MMRHVKLGEGRGQASGDKKKQLRPYQAPKLIGYGSIAKLTQGASTRAGEGGSARTRNG